MESNNHELLSACILSFRKLFLELEISTSFFAWVDVEREAIFQSSACLLESAVVQLLAAEARDPHVSWLVGQVLVAHLARTLPHDSVVEWFWLVELFSVLSSILVSVRILFGGPACAVPEGRVHHIARAIIEQGLSWSIQVSLVCNMFLELDCLLLGELLGWVAILEHGRWLHFWVDITRSESCFVRWVLRVIMWVRLWHCLGTISPRGGIERLIRLWNPLSIESTPN